MWDNTSLVNESIDYLASSESLLEFALAEGYYEESFLEVHYRSHHHYLIDFSNAAFYGNRLTPLPVDEDIIPIEFEQINGIYQEHANEKEADAIVQYLLELADSNKKKLPSVGVATFNLHQRNLILEKLQAISLEAPSKGGQIQRLFSAGLFVKNLENIQGDERDILLISTTFGRRPDDSFLQNFGPINRQNGYRLLNVIITRAKHKIKVFTSIPKQYYQNYRTEIMKNGNNGKGIFYAYLAYAEAVSNQDESSRQAILDLVYENCHQKAINEMLYSLKDQSFEQTVIAFLEQAFPNASIQQNHAYGGLILPLTISDSDDNIKLALYYDIYTDNPSSEAYAWDIFREQRLEKMGIACQRIWSKEWWSDVNQAQAKLKAVVEKVLSD
jgi:hypothetical protein